MYQGRCSLQIEKGVEGETKRVWVGEKGGASWMKNLSYSGGYRSCVVFRCVADASRLS
jgi:hypothetical protein